MTTQPSGSAPGRSAIAVTAGDPCGIGPEVVLKALAHPAVAKLAPLVVIGDARTLRETARQLKQAWPFDLAPSLDAVGTAVLVRPLREMRKPLLLDIGVDTSALSPGQISAVGGRCAALAIEHAVALAMMGAVRGIATAPLQKEALSMAGYTDLGHTEMLARLSKSKRVAMVFWAREMSVALLSTHYSLREALRLIKAKRIFEMLTLIDREWQRFFGAKPRIAVAGLNPHAGEGGRFGVEDAHEVAPAVERARGMGVAAEGPLPPDSVFNRARQGEFDIVLALYHDQGTIPVKLLYGFRAVNITLGLPFVRTSVDHGTALEIAGKGVASEESMVEAIKLAGKLVLAQRR